MMKKYIAGAAIAALLGAGAAGTAFPQTAHAGLLGNVFGAILGGGSAEPSSAVPTRYVPAPSRDLNNRIVDRDLTTDERMLFVAIDKADYETVDLMLKKGVDINAYYVRMGTTPLGRAMEQDNRAMMQFLLERGADVRGYVYEKKDYHVFSYLVAAVQRRDLGLVEYLHNWGAGINSVSWDYNHGYHNALFRLGVSAEDVPIMHYIIDKGIDVNYQTSNGNRTPLIHISQQWISAELRRSLIEMLLRAGAVTSLRDGAGHTAVDYCLERNDLENARLIQQY